MNKRQIERYRKLLLVKREELLNRVREARSSEQEITDKEARPPLYLALMESGSLKVGASDFRIVERGLDAAFVRRNAGRLSAGDFLVLDANLAPALVDRYGIFPCFMIGYILDAELIDAASYRSEQARGPGPLEVIRRPALRTVVDNRDMADGHLVHRHRPC